MNSIQEKEFRRRQISFVGLLSAITVILLGLHYYIYYYFAASIDLKIPLWTVYAFHFIVVLLIYSFINYRHTSGKTDVFNVFMILTFFGGGSNCTLYNLAISKARSSRGKSLECIFGFREY